VTLAESGKMARCVTIFLPFNSLAQMFFTCSFLPRAHIDMANDSPDIRRVTPRKPLRARAQVAAPGAPVQSALTVDVSVSGVSLMLPEQLATGAACQIRFEIPVGGKTHVVQGSAKVVYCVCVGQKGFRAGFQFTDADQARTQLINAL
jgi:hypothetical protein